VALQHWHKLRPELPHLQFVLWDEEEDAVVAHGRTLPARAADGLPGGIDDMLETWFGDGGPPEPDVLSAMVAVVDRKRQGQGPFTARDRGDGRHRAEQRLLRADRTRAPDVKDRYPLIPMERYASWRRDDGLPFDPWLRVHARLGAELLHVCRASMTVAGSAAEWEEWTGLAFPGDGDYVVPGALVPVPVRFADGQGTYVEPNVWMRRTVG